MSPAIKRPHHNAKKPWQIERAKSWATWLRTEVAEGLLNNHPHIRGVSNKVPMKAFERVKARLTRWHESQVDKGQKFGKVDRYTKEPRKLVTPNGMAALLTIEKGNTAGNSPDNLWAKYERGDTVKPTQDTLDEIQALFPCSKSFWECGPDDVPMWALLSNDTSVDQLWFPIVNLCFKDVAWLERTNDMLARDVDIFNGNPATQVYLTPGFGLREIEKRAKSGGAVLPRTLADMLSRASPRGLLYSITAGIHLEEAGSGTPPSNTRPDMWPLGQDGKEYGSAVSVLLAVQATMLNQSRGKKYRWNLFHDDDEMFHLFWNLRFAFVDFAAQYGLQKPASEWVTRALDAYKDRNAYVVPPDIEDVRALQVDGAYVMTLDRGDLIKAIVRREGGIPKRSQQDMGQE